MDCWVEKKLGCKWRWCMIAVVVVVVGILAREGWGEEEEAAAAASSSSWCVNQLLPCMKYLNNNDDDEEVADDCCDPLKWVIKRRPECLCNLMSTRGSNQAAQAGINVTQAQQLPARCGQHVNPISCLTPAAGGSPNSKSSVSNSAAFSLPIPTMALAAPISLLATAYVLT